MKVIFWGEMTGGANSARLNRGGARDGSTSRPRSEPVASRTSPGLCTVAKSGNSKAFQSTSGPRAALEVGKDQGARLEKARFRHRGRGTRQRAIKEKWLFCANAARLRRKRDLGGLGGL